MFSQRTGFGRTFERIDHMRVAAGNVQIEVEHNGETLDVITLGEDGEREAVLSFVL